ncbi:phage tail protein [Pandoraea morbifera]|uniref:Phage tail protein n=1 Tax=Pandoraea morbifera TaxID=2508300 RepID=A0A5E4V2G0_9BURK|nr:tail assembly protein [Pandoraea morbifera]VVE05539.1 phage tail protein [Pandoraea morbifera]
MSEKLRDIRLYGALGAKFGRSFRLAVDSPAEAIRALCVIIPGFKAELLASKSKGVGYSVFTGKRNLGADELDLPPGSQSIRIAPFILGAKRGGLFNVLLGAALITAAFFVPQAGLFGVKALSAGAVGLMGASMALGGIVQLLSPQQVGLSVKDSPDNGANYNFNGPVNTQAQGNPVPVLYGRMIVGGAVVSAGIYAEDQA